jgi:hypothetical protein
MRPGKPAVVRFYFDADVLGLAKVLVQVRAEVTYPGDPGGTLHRRTRLLARSRRPPSKMTCGSRKLRRWAG